MIKITQSYLKDLIEWRNGEACAKQMYAKYVDKQQVSPTSDAQNAGCYVEYLATGALPKSGKVPEPKRLKNGKLAALYQYAENAATLFEEVCLNHDIEVLEASVKLENDIAEGTADIIAKIAGEKCIIDMKFSGHFASSFRKWSWLPDAVAENESYLLQAVHYSWLSGLPFYFLIFDSSNGNNYRLMKVHLEEHHIRQHELMVRNEAQHIARVLGSAATPSRQRCGECALADSCKYATTMNPLSHVYPQI